MLGEVLLRLLKRMSCTHSGPCTQKVHHGWKYSSASDLSTAPCRTFHVCNFQAPLDIASPLHGFCRVLFRRLFQVLVDFCRSSIGKIKTFFKKKFIHPARKYIHLYFPLPRALQDRQTQQQAILDTIVLLYSERYLSAT